MAGRHRQHQTTPAPEGTGREPALRSIREDSSPATVIDLLDRLFHRAGHSWPTALRYLTLALVPLLTTTGCLVLLVTALPAQASTTVGAASVAAAALAARRKRQRGDPC